MLPYACLAASALWLTLGSCLPAPPPPPATPTIPLSAINNSGASPLPTPSGPPLYIALGVGTQNYTCTSAGTYKATGALARLFDATAYLSSHHGSVSTLPQDYRNAFVALSCAHRLTNDVQADDACEETANNEVDRLPVLGQHYFTASGTPTFDLCGGAGHPFLYAKKVGDVPAPSSRDVDWLYLASNGSPANQGVSSVYRLETAGGTPPSSCTGNETIEIGYGAEYWFYK